MGVESVVGWCWEEEKSVAKEGGGGEARGGNSYPKKG